MIELPIHHQKSLSDIKFIDLFAGIGGFRLALESFGAKCIFSCEINKYSCLTYEKNFGDNPYSDIRQIKPSEIPQHDILCAGFPCQAFSISGKQKGLNDLRSDVVFSLFKIIEYQRPSILFLENVPNLLKHDKGKTFAFIVKQLESLNYQVEYQILDASDYRLPQSRRRLFIVAFNKNVFLSPIKYSFPVPFSQRKIVKDILENKLSRVIVNSKDKVINWLTENFSCQNTFAKPQRIGTINKGGQGERIYSIYAPAITISASSGGSAPNTGAYLVNDTIRGLTSRECARLQGFPDNFIIPVAENQALQQFGNSLPVNVVQFIIKGLIDQGIINQLSKKNKYQCQKLRIRKTEALLPLAVFG
jgi:DNA (cytosine-5)-methyltransferase 1